MSDFYVLDGKKVVPASLEEWAKAFEKADRQVALTKFPSGIEISTVFLGSDHSFGHGPPLLFETMVFAPYHSDIDRDTYRYTTWDEAETGHKVLVKKLLKKLL